MDSRKSDADEGRIPQIVRSARFIETDEGWFFRTREKLMLGPYLDKFDAEVSASLLVARLAQLDPEKDPTPVIIAFEHDPSNATKAHEEQKQAVNLKAIKRRHYLSNALPTFHKAWSAITQIKVVKNQ